ncbi:hypothetical protein F2P56_021801 [Juglans regia]|uniref:Photolyase/cryptochrome alpha/beta domain-containing protein n=2 Tax=Juglans regia TaxID=51240 RepID=A0A833X2S1_JUGRE|nr:uncharacterized protein LOC109014095 isoform X2 [Juglans regia]KAF5457719.1 hypothetical protein F2P56_021801 [Juglans regia]
MPLLTTFPHCPSLSYPPKTLLSSRTRFRCPSFGAKMTASDKNGAAILWFKHDLRIDDHPGLVAASKSRVLLPLYVFDHRILSRFSDEMQQLVLIAVEDLRKSLKDLGSDLMIRFGSAENVILDLVKEVKATNIYAEEEVEYDLRLMMDVVKKTLETVYSQEGSARLELWQTPFFDTRSLKNLPESHGDFQKLQFSITSPLPPPALCSVKTECDWGPVPTFDDLKKFMNKNGCKPQNSWTSIKETSAESILQIELLKPGERNRKDLSFRHSQRKQIDKSAFVTQKGNIVGGGTNTVLNALAAYLRYLEGTARDDWQEVHERLRNAETRDGASFIALFGPALCLGIISRRRVHYEAIIYEKERNAGFLSPFGYSAATVAAAIDAVCSMEWYWVMALKSLISYDEPYSIRIWRWKGFLIQYTVLGHEGPAILLVHGFGAFLGHYRDNIYGIAEGGNRVWALTILGFGKSEKPNIVYTELMWAELLRDFIVEVVGEPVHLVGNSIGGYIVAIVARFWHTLAKSVVLINSAGDIIPGYASVPFTKERKISGASWLGARLLLFFLRSRLKDIVKNCYPTKPERVDDWLLDEMLRASYDPGVPVVLESIFSFNISIPLNYLLEGFKETVLIIQGMKDPISDSKSKVVMLKENCAGVIIRELDAGHCPHDELPQEVNSIICEWVASVHSKLPAESLP